MHLYVGNWNSRPGPKGISFYELDPAKGIFRHVETVHPEIGAGQMLLDAERLILYTVDETSDRRGETGGGGYLLAFSIDARSGSLTLERERETFSTKPCNLCMDSGKKFMLVVHHGDNGYVTKMAKADDGRFTSRVLFDDVTLVSFAMDPDGYPGEIRDIWIAPGEISERGYAIPHLHSVTADPSGGLFAVCDKGLDRICTFRLDPDTGRLSLLQELPVDRGCSPRYGIFHPSLPYYFANNEQVTEIHSYRYRVSDGSMTRLASAPLLSNKNHSAKASLAEPTDLALSPDGKHLFAAIRGHDLIAVLEVTSSGSLLLKQNLPCGGNNPRCLCVSPDGEFLLVGNTGSGTITTFSISGDGILRPMRLRADAVSPSSMKIHTGLSMV